MNWKVLIAALLLTTMVQAQDMAPPPKGWQALGGGGPLALPNRCDLGVDSYLASGGQPNMTVKCLSEEPSFGGLRQNFEAAPFAGKRVRFSAYVMASGIVDVGPVEGSGGLWVAVGRPRSLRMDRIPERAVRGWTSWELRDAIFDVPADADQVSIGFWMQGKGQIWIKDVAFEEVSSGVPVNVSLGVGPDLRLQ